MHPFVASQLIIQPHLASPNRLKLHPQNTLKLYQKPPLYELCKQMTKIILCQYHWLIQSFVFVVLSLHVLISLPFYPRSSSFNYNQQLNTDKNKKSRSLNLIKLRDDLSCYHPVFVCLKTYLIQSPCFKKFKDRNCCCYNGHTRSLLTTH